MRTARLLLGDCRDRLRDLPESAVQCCVTSPPYYGLRDYKLPASIWGGDPGCEHAWGDTLAECLRPGRDFDPCGSETISRRYDPPLSAACSLCGAWRGCLGLEPTPQLFVAHMVEVFAEVWRVLRDDGTLWLNLGDSYVSAGGSGLQGKRGQRFDRRHTQEPLVRHRAHELGMGPKNLMGIPWRVAIALQGAGWTLRSEIIWTKTAPMPESVRDRPTRAHEHIFLLSKGGQYHYDADAVREPVSGNAHARGGGVNPKAAANAVGSRQNASFSAAVPNLVADRNLRSVWEISPEPCAEAHFACVDAETECLTAEGWKRHDQLQVGELAAQFDMATRNLSWGAIEKVSTYGVTNQPMVIGARRDLSVMLTPNHRCVIQRRRAHGEADLGLMPPSIVRADELLTSHRIPTAAPWASDDGDTSIAIEWAELLGWYIAEGHESKQSPAVEIYQSRSANPAKVERIAKLLRQVGAEWTMAKYDRQWNGSPSVACAFRVTGYAAFRLREVAPGKRMPTGALLWERGRLQALFDGLIAGDGHTRVDNRVSFIQKDTATANMVQAVGVRLGMAATISQHEGGTWRVYFTKHKTRSFRGTAGKGEPLRTQPYTGVVWCPKLPLGTWVARRDGRVFITGNTFPSEIPRRAILAGSRAGDTVLDPFMGSGRTGTTALSLGRSFVGIDLSREYLETIARPAIEAALAQRVIGEESAPAPLRVETQAEMFAEASA